MKKKMLGVFLGISIFMSMTVHAAEIKKPLDLIGKAVEGAFRVKIDGVELKNQAIVVDGTSYLPVRTIGEALDYEVTFNNESGILLEKRKQTPVSKPIDNIFSNGEIPKTTLSPTSSSLLEIETMLRTLEAEIEQKDDQMMRLGKEFEKLSKESPEFETKKVELKKMIAEVMKLIQEYVQLEMKKNELLK